MDTAKPNFLVEVRSRIPLEKKVGNWVQDCTASNGQSLKAGLIYANMPEIRRRFEALGIAKLD